MNQINLLLVEDDDDHASLVRRVFDRHPAIQSVQRARDGAEALEVLRNAGAATEPRPNLLLMDLKLPKKSGLEVLEEIRSDDALSHLPIIILTTSSAEMDRARAYQHHANSYLLKPIDFEQFQELIDEVATYWGKWNQSPPDALATP